jgi:hypothetical protein
MAPAAGVESVAAIDFTVIRMQQLLVHVPGRYLLELLLPKPVLLPAELCKYSKKTGRLTVRGVTRICIAKILDAA